MVITVTLNPAMDKTLIIDNFSLGEVNRAPSIRYDIGGKGINVSKVLKNFGVESICTGFLGGMWEGEFKKELEARGIKDEFIRIKGNTRTNTKVVDMVNKTYTDINEAGPEISEEEFNSFISYYTEVCNPGDIVVLSGGVSQSIPKDIYARLIKIAKQKGAKVILDADGELLKSALEEKPDIIKPNEHELEKLFNLNIASREQLIETVYSLRDKGISKILVSLGDKGALYATENGTNAVEGFKVKVKSTVGAGDSMVAALVYSVLNNYNDVETLKFANACGAASVTLDGTEACTLKQVNEFLQK
jgi:1-phosphofructokinase